MKNNVFFFFYLEMWRLSLAKQKQKHNKMKPQQAEQNNLVVLDLSKIAVIDLKLMLIKPEASQIFI